MERFSSGRLLRSFAFASCIAFSSAWIAPAHAQISNFWNEKFAQPGETPAAQMQLRLGSAVAAAGGRVVTVGGHSVYAFGQNSVGQWTQTAKITAPDAGILTGPIVFDGTSMLVRGYTPAQVSVVYSYTYDGSRWRAVGIIKGVAEFGRSMALDGCTALISSSPEEGAPASSPHAFVHYFDRCRTGQWTYVNSIYSPTTTEAAYERFGASVAVSGNTALIGAPNSGPYGRAYYYTKTGDVWSFKQAIEETGAQKHWGFGKTVALSNNLALVAAEYRDEERYHDGMVIAFGTNGTTWTQVGPVTFYQPVETLGYVDFGRRIIITPNYVYVTAPGVWSPRHQNSGTVYVFRRSGPTGLLAPYHVQPWMPLPPGTPPEAQGPYGGGHFGADIAVAGSNLFVGSPTRHVENKALLVNGLLSIYEVPPYTAPP
jgi:hypothetical protein